MSLCASGSDLVGLPRPQTGTAVRFKDGHEMADMVHDNMPRTLIELTRVGISMVAKANLRADVPDQALAQRILSEADPLFIEELKLALIAHRMVSWIQSERRMLKRKQSERGQHTKPKGPRAGNYFRLDNTSVEGINSFPRSAERGPFEARNEDEAGTG